MTASFLILFNSLFTNHPNMGQYVVTWRIYKLFECLSFIVCGTKENHEKLRILEVPNKIKTWHLPNTVLPFKWTASVTQKLHSVESVTEKSCLCAIKTLTNGGTVPYALIPGNGLRWVTSHSGWLTPSTQWIINNSDIGDWGSIVGIVTPYRLCQGFNSHWWQEIFVLPQPFQTIFGAQSASFSGYQGFSQK